MSYPLTIRFKILAVARQLSVYGSDQRLLMYAKQKAFKLKEAITIFADEAQTQPLYRVQADRIIDFAATYAITQADGEYLGAVRQKGMKSLWRTRFEILRGDKVLFSVQEENPWAKVGNSLFEGIPLLGMLSGYVFHPRYRITADSGGIVVRVTKEPAFLESVFKVERLPTTIPPDAERLLLIGAVVTILLERQRG
jgi:uncharacterized protein YxjI